MTKIDHAYEADAYFPDLDKLPEWREYCAWIEKLPYATELITTIK